MAINEDQATDNYILPKECDVIEHHDNEKRRYDATNKYITYIRT
jgi:hypothetical protein